MKLAITALVLALVASSAMASSYLWNGSVSGQWIVAGNWTPIDGGSTFPQTGGDTAIFFSDASVTTTGLIALPNVNVTGTLSLNIPSGVLASPNYTSITGPGGLKVASGNMKFNQGDASNTYAGGLEINTGGKVEVSGADGRALIPAGGLTVTHGGLQFEANDVIDHACPMNISNGWVNWGAEAEQLGVLTVSGMGADFNDYIDFTAGVHFADSHLATWNGALEIDFSSSAAPNLADAVGNLYIGTNASGLTPAQLATVFFADDDFGDAVTYPAALDANGRLYPVPEPMTLSLLLVGGVAGLIRRRR